MFLFLSAPWHTENPQRSKVTGEDSNSTGSEEKEGEGEVAGKDGTLWSEGRIVIIYIVMEREKINTCGWLVYWTVSIAFPA